MKMKKFTVFFNKRLLQAIDKESQKCGGDWMNSSSLARAMANAWVLIGNLQGNFFFCKEFGTETPGQFPTQESSSTMSKDWSRAMDNARRIEVVMFYGGIPDGEHVVYITFLFYEGGRENPYSKYEFYSTAAKYGLLGHGSGCNEQDRLKLLQECNAEDDMSLLDRVAEAAED